MRKKNIKKNFKEMLFPPKKTPKNTTHGTQNKETDSPSIQTPPR